MVKHIILWQLKDELSPEQKEEVKKNIKSGLEGLANKIHGLVNIHVHVNGLETSNADVLLDSTFTDFDSLKDYSIHPSHVAVANEFVRPYTKTRVCMDYATA